MRPAGLHSCCSRVANCINRNADSPVERGGALALRLGPESGPRDSECWPIHGMPRSAYARVTMATKRAPRDLRILPSCTARFNETQGLKDDVSAGCRARISLFEGSRDGCPRLEPKALGLGHESSYGWEVCRPGIRGAGHFWHGCVIKAHWRNGLCIAGRVYVPARIA